MNCNRYILIGYLLLSFLPGSEIGAQTLNDEGMSNYYRKHVVVCVDQKSKGNMEKLYDVLSALLKGENLSKLGIDGHSLYPDNSSDLFFDSSKDELTILFAGISGGGQPMKADWNFLNNKANDNSISSNEMCLLLDSCFIHKCVSFRKSGLNLSEYLEQIVKPNFKVQENMTRLSSYIYPLLLTHLDLSVPSTEYIILVISDFKPGGSPSSDSATRYNLNQLLKNKHYKAFGEYRNKLQNPFDYNTSKIDISFPVSASNEIVPRIVGGKLTPLAIEGNSCKPQRFSMKQEKWNGSKYTIDDAKVLFPQNQQIQIYRIDIEFQDENGDLIECHSLKGDIESYRKGHFIEIPTFDVDLSLSESVNHNANSRAISYVVYTKVVDKDGKTIIPYVFKEEIAPDYINASAPRTWLPILLLVIITVLLCAAARYIFIRRGKNAIPNIDVDVSPISNTKYMNVQNCEVKDYDCWYVEDENDRSRQIRFKIRITPSTVPFAQKHRFAVKYQVEDIDHNSNFTFKPVEPNSDGTLRQLNTFYPLSNVYDPNVTPVDEQNVDVDVFISTSNPIEYDIDNILEMKLTVCLFMIDGSEERRVGDPISKVYKFIVRPKLRNSNVWVAFDAGTTGATVAYGITGNWLDQDEINLVYHKKEEVGSTESLLSAVFPSVVAIKDESKAFKSEPSKVEEYVEGKDFLFGEDASGEPYNRFQSIKKFLGYKSPQLLKDSKGNEEGVISGQDLAHLLVKGMFRQFEETVECHEDENIRLPFYENGMFDPQRAVVAVPNNYTLDKVQDMVNSVERLGKFKEVHFLYESEGVMMTYLRKSLPVLKEKENCTFVVFDMGGATINITVFGLDLWLGKNGNIHKIKLTSLAKIGYYVGGDDIDYAIIQFIYSIPSLNVKIKEDLSSESTDKELKSITEEDVLEHQKRHKNELIDFARQVKRDWVDVQNGESKEDNIMVNMADFWTSLRSRIIDIMDIELPSEPTEMDRDFVNREKVSHTIMDSYVFSNISDALSELMKSPRFPSGTPIELILSGRSVLYPGVKETILKSFKGRNVHLWKGFNKDGKDQFDEEKVKTAVAEGACWYAMYSRDINLQHNYITSSYGFEDRNDNRKCYHELIENGREFDIDGLCRQEISGDDLFDSNLNDVKFLQMMGADVDSIVSQDIRHKKNLLDEIKPDQIKTSIEKIVFTVDDKGNYFYEVFQRGFQEPITRESNRAFRNDKDIQNEIKDENSRAYEFATTNTAIIIPSKKDNGGVIKPEKSNGQYQKNNTHGLK